MPLTESLEARVTAALAGIQNPRLDNDLLSAGMIRDLQVSEAGKVSFSFLLAPEDPATLVRSARAAVAAGCQPGSAVKVGTAAGGTSCTVMLARLMWRFR